MYRLFNVGVLALAGMLAACAGAGDVQTTQPAGSPVSTTGGQSPAASPGTAGVSPACSDSFAPLEEMEVSSISELGDLADEVEPTLEACESVDEWVAAAGEVIADDIDPDAARMLLGMHCDSPALSDTLICEELASS